MRTSRLLALIAVASLLTARLWLAAPLCAQAPATPAPPAAEPPPPADDAFGAEEGAMADEAEAVPPADQPRAVPRPRPNAKADETETAPALPNDPAVLAVLESHPKTPSELLRAVNILVGLEQVPLAKPFAEQLVKLKLDQKAKAELVARFNPADLLKLASNAQLAEQLGPFIDDLLKSADAYRRDPKRLAEWAGKLSDPNEAVRALAAVALVDGGESAVAPLVAILAGPAKSASRPAARSVLVHLGGTAVPALLGVLESRDAALRAEVVDLLGQIGSREAVSQLLAPLVSSSSTPQLSAAAARALARILGRTPKPSEAVAMLERAARQALEQSRHEIDDVLAPTVVWHWNAKRNESMPIEYSPTGAAVAQAVRLARDLHQLDPANAARRQLYLTALLSAAKYRVGLGKPLPAGSGTAYSIAAHEGVDSVDRLLDYALNEGYLPAATAAAQILGDIGTPELLTRGGAAPSPLARAADHADRRVRFAAIEAIMKLQPSEPFAGSSKVLEGIGFLASSYGTPRALIVHPRSDEGRKVAGLAATLGYEGDIATNGRRAFQMATASPDYEFIFIHSAIDRIPVDRLTQQLRKDPRTAALPVGFMAPLYDLDRVSQFSHRVPRSEAFLQPQNEDEMKLLSDRVLSHAGQSLVPHEERLAQAVAALDWLAAIQERPSQVFDVTNVEAALLKALYVPQLSSKAAAVLGHVGSPKAQRSLVELGGSAALPLEMRTAAAAAFTASVRQFGVALTGPEIVHQYDLYNSNAGRDADTHQVLGAILDAIEQRATRT